MDFITDISRIVLPIITVMLLVKCILALWLGHPKEKIYGYISDMHSGERHPLNMWETSIGRGSSCDIVLPYDSIPRVQAVISRRLDGWYIFETLSKAPIKVNGTSVSKKQTIENGDIITLGKVRFRFEIADDPVQRVGKQKKKTQKKAEAPAQKTRTTRPQSAQKTSAHSLRKLRHPHQDRRLVRVQEVRRHLSMAQAGHIQLRLPEYRKMSDASHSTALSTKTQAKSLSFAVMR